MPFAKEGCPRGEQVFIEFLRYFKSDGGQYDVVLIFNKIIYWQTEAVHLWYENLQNSLLDRGFVVRKVDPWFLMSKTVIDVLYVNNYICW